jgi:hypothetical protein
MFCRRGKEEGIRQPGESDNVSACTHLSQYGGHPLKRHLAPRAGATPCLR